jgi:N-methylhydantoinase B
LNLGDGDIAIANDPYSGGTTLSDFTLVLGIKTESATTDVLLARRISCSPRLADSGKLDDEGVRVPPTPLASRGEVNRDLLQAIASAPLAPSHLAEMVLTAIDEMKEIATRIRHLAQDPESVLRKSVFKTYLADCSRSFEAAMGRLPLGTTQALYQFPTGETLKLQLRLNEDHLQFDFGGTESSKTIAITDLAALGACTAAVWAVFGEDIPLNTGSLHHLQVSAPSRTMLAAAPPVGTNRGMTEGAAAISRLAYEAIAQLTPALKSAKGAATTSCFQIKFEDGRSLSFTAPPGSGASSSHEGVNAFTPWANCTDFVSHPEQIEAEWPVRFVSAGVRVGSGGKGKRNGGDGVSIGFTALKAGELTWMASSLGVRHDGENSGRAGQPAELEILRVKSGAREELKTLSGRARVEAGDQVFFLSPGGGGSGEPASETAE